MLCYNFLMAKKEEQSPVDPQFAQAQKEIVEAEKAYQRSLRMTRIVPLAKRIAVLVWAVFDVILVLLFLYFVLGYLILGQFSDRQSVSEFFSEIGSLHAESLRRSPDALFTSDAIVMDFDDDKYDFYAEIENGNTDWYATFSYGFETEDGETTDLSPGFVFPGETRPLIQVNQTLEGSPSRAELVVEDVVWRRIDAHDIEDIDQWMGEHQDFTLSSSDYGDKIELEEDSIVRSVFTIQNNSPYNYWSAAFWVILERGGSVVGVNQTTIAGLEASEEREVTINWFGRAPALADDLSIYPVIDYFDKDVYMDQPRGNDIDARDPMDD